MKRSLTFTTIVFTIALAFLTAAEASGQEQFGPNNAYRSTSQINFRLPFRRYASMIDVEVVSGKIVFQGDIILGEESMLYGPQLASAGSSDRRWPNGLIPIVVPTTHPRYHDIMKALDIVDRDTNLSFVKRTTETDYVEFVSEDGCASYYGRKGGRQTVTIGSAGDCVPGSIIHEILHASGIFHEQARSDRDDFVTINFANVQAGKENNFKKYDDEDLNGVDIGNYDYGSIMHYGTHFFGKDGKQTITPKSDVEIGQRRGLSEGDLAGIRNMYPVKARPYTPMIRVEIGDTRVIVDPNSKLPYEPRRKLGGVIRQP